MLPYLSHFPYIGNSEERMTEFQQTLFYKFYDFFEERDILPSHQNVKHTFNTYDIYSVPYSSDVTTFISSLTGVDLSIVKQYVFINQFLFFLQKNYEMNTSFNLKVTENFIQFDLKEVDVGAFILDNTAFFHISIYSDDKVCINDKYYNDYDFEVSYNAVLHEINRLLNPSIITFNNVLDIHKKSKLSVIQENISSPDVMAVSFEHFVVTYYNNLPPAIKHEPFMYSLTQQSLKLFLKDNLSSDYYHKVMSIISLSCFIEQIHKRKPSWPSNFSSINIEFPDMSQYSEIKRMYSLIFGVMPTEHYRCKIDFNVDGSVYFSYFIDDIMIEFDNLDSIYDYIRTEFIKVISVCLKVDFKDLTFKHLKLYEMMLV